jgi:acyl transferase domain-containing protein/NAD(P)-dependent dehydrogenase (short-subunit alcohol dehydrogenase family)
MDAKSDSPKYAIVGIGCRLPPAASSLQTFWRFLIRGGNALRPIKRDRWDWRQFFDEDPNRPGKSYAPKAASLDADVQQFDPLAFGISPREAASLDPQQRLLLEVTWEAFEDAGVPLERASGSPTGVFIGGFCLDHLIGTMQPANRHLLNAHSPAGVMMTVLSNRLSHAFNLRGPSLTLDTACSSSLVAIHYACQSLRLRECDMALAGGVNVMSRPEFPIMMSKGHFLSHHGECRAFDESAAGYARGEGAGVLLIKRYEDAIAQGDDIHAVIRGTGVNQDGHTDGISLPNSEAQESLVREVYRKAGVLPADVDYIEAHGTGTQAGDPAEARALDASFSEGRDSKHKLIVGSVKTNIGHTEAVAGVAGTIKAIGVLKFRQVPKNLHFENPNPKIPFDQYCLEVAKETRTLPGAEEKPTLYAGVNSFGYGGTNAHIVLESAPPVSTPPATQALSLPALIPFSAQSGEALRDLAGKLAFQLGQPTAGSLADVAYTTAFRRSHLRFRAAALAENIDDLRQKLVAGSTGQPHEGLVVASQPVSRGAGLAFVYTGMGPQWWAMGQELIRTEPIVATTLDEIDSHFQKLAGWSLKEAMLADEATSRMERTDLAQPANFALQVALTRLWDFYGIRPAAVVGHSVGEVAAAYVAGVYTLEEAVRVSYHRSRLQQTMAGTGGAMLAVGLAERDAEREIANFPAVSVAAVNSFQAVTLSGDAGQLQQIATGLEQRGIFQKFLRVEVAYHSPQMDPLRDEVLSILADLDPKPARIPLYSTAYGKLVPAEMWNADYWWRNVRQAVHFASAAAEMFDAGFSIFLEIGPHPVLGNSIKECAAHLQRTVTCFTSLRRKEPEKLRILTTLGELYCTGFDPDWARLSPTTGKFLPAPQYPWQRQRHWLESERSKMERLGLDGPVYLNRTVLAPTPCWEVEINRNYFPFLHDHGVQDQTVFAGLAYIEAGLSLSRQVHGKPGVVLENISVERVLIVESTKIQHLITEFNPEEGRFVISSRTEGEEESLQRHCRGRMLPQSEPQAPRIDLPALQAMCPTPVDVEAFHEYLERCELFYGPTFRPISAIWMGEGCYLKKIDASISAPEESHLLHPTIFDAAIRGVIYCAGSERLYVPFSFEQFQYFSRPESAECYAFGKLLSQSDSTLVADVWLTDAQGNVHAHARRMTLQAIDMKARSDEPALLYQTEWKESPLESLAETDGRDVIILADSADSDMELAARLADLLPGADLALDAAAGGMSVEVEQSRLEARKRIITLWGTKSGDSAAFAQALNEKLIGLLKSVAIAHPAGAEVTIATRGSQPVGGDKPALNWPASSLAAIGLVAQNEMEGMVCRSVDLDSGGAEQIVAELAARTRGDIAYREGSRYERRVGLFHEKAEETAAIAKSVDEPVVLVQAAKGRIDSLHYEPAQRSTPAAGEVEIRIHKVALNYKDLLKVDGRIHPAAYENTFNGSEIGMECTGVVLRCGPGCMLAEGDEVVAVIRDGFRSYATLPEQFVEKIPKGLGMDAAAIPVVYLAAYHGLVNVARLQPGERILIHHATGGVGLAAIEIARWIGAEIFATAGSEEKHEFLRTLGVGKVYSSRTLDFSQQIQADTNGEGIDVVIGAQTGQAVHASLGLLRAEGRYIEIGKKDIAEDNSLPLRAFNRGLTFSSIDMDRLANDRPALLKHILRAVLDRFEAGDFRPSPCRTFPAREIHEAFQEMAQSRHIGKLLVDFSTGEVDVTERPPAMPVIRSDGTYIITGGTSGFGLATAQWLATQGAGKLVLVSRSGGKAAGMDEVRSDLESRGAKVEILSVDVSDASQVRELIGKCHNASSPLRGVIHGAMVLDDAMMSDLSEESFRRVFQPKVAGALHLADALGTEENLDFLIFYSSISALIGNRGQTSYIAANAMLDGAAHALRARGIPAISINWGALSETGVVARDEHLGRMLTAGGITGLDNRTAMAALEQVIRLSRPQIGAFIVDWAKWAEGNSPLADDPRFRDLVARAAGGGDDVGSRFRAELADASREQRLRAIEEHLQDVLAATLKMAKDTVPLDRKLNEMGVDSLLVLELSLGINERIGVNFSAMEFLKGPNLQQLAAMAESRLWKN